MTLIRESDVQEWLSFVLRGRREKVLRDLGRVDIMFEEDGVQYVIEVKKGTQFLHALGQVKGYASYLEKESENNGRNKRQVCVIALFGWKSMSKERIQECSDVCDNMGVKCWFLDEHFLQFLYLLERSNAESGKDIRPSNYFLEQYLHEKVKEQRRYEFHNLMLSGSLPEISYEEDNSSCDEFSGEDDPE